MTKSLGPLPEQIKWSAAEDWPGWVLEADEVVALPLDELALQVLQDVVAANETNWQNWMGQARQLAYRERQDAADALAEAWQWLFNHGLVVPGDSHGTGGPLLVTRRGHEFLLQGAAWIRAVQRLDVALVPELEFTARPQFLRGDYETAAFTAMKEVEVQVRAKAGLGNDLLGVALMQQALRGPKNDTDSGGPLFSAELEPGESLAQMNLFAGAIGLFKNPSSHRRVDLTDPTEAAEIILLADLLLRLLRKIDGPPAGGV